MLFLRYCYHNFASRIFIVVTFVICVFSHIQVPINLLTFMVFGTSGLILQLRFITYFHSLIFCSPILEPHLDLKKSLMIFLRNIFSKKSVTQAFTLLFQNWHFFCTHYQSCCINVTEQMLQILRVIAFLVLKKNKHNKKNTFQETHNVNNFYLLKSICNCFFCII